MFIEDPMEFVEAPLELSEAQLTAVVIGILTWNTHIVRDNVPGAHCEGHAMVSAIHGLEQLYFADIQSPAYERYERLRELVSKQLDMSKVIYDTDARMVNELLAFSQSVMQHPYRATYQRILGILQQDLRIADRAANVGYDTSYAQFLEMTEKARMWFNEHHVEDPSPNTLYPAQVEQMQQATAAHMQLFGGPDKKQVN